MRTSDRAGEGRRGPAKASELIARQLADQILEHELAPGDRLSNERAMMEEYEAGRTTVREALRLLETRGVITIRRGPGGGAIVRRPRAEDLGEALTLLLQFEGASLQDVMDARVAIEPTIARFAAERITEEEVDMLQATVDEMRSKAGVHRVFQEQNWQFHSQVSRASRSVVLSVHVDSLKSILDGAIVGVRYDTKRHFAVADAHQRIVDALRSRDADASVVAMRQHLSEANQYWATMYGGLMKQALRWVR